MLRGDMSVAHVLAYDRSILALDKSVAGTAVGPALSEFDHQILAW